MFTHQPGAKGWELRLSTPFHQGPYFASDHMVEICFVPAVNNDNATWVPNLYVIEVYTWDCPNLDPATNPRNLAACQELIAAQSQAKREGRIEAVLLQQSLEILQRQLSNIQKN